MEFYTYQFFVNQTSDKLLIKYLVFVGLLGLLLVIVLKKFRSQNKMKYRDLIILLSLVIIFMAGIQINEYEVGKNNQSNSSQMLNFLDNISENQQVSVDELAVNSKYVKDEMLVRVGKNYYQINMNADLSSFKLEETFLLNEKEVKIIKE